MELNLLPPTLQLHFKNMKERIYMKEVMEKAGKHLEDNFIRGKSFFIYEETFDDYEIKNNNLIVKYDDLIFFYIRFLSHDHIANTVLKLTQNEFCIYNNKIDDFFEVDYIV